MKILVCISSVPETTSKINFTSDQKAFDTNGIQWVINPLDEFALSKAIKLQESHQATVTVACLGESISEPVIRKALAMGANDAVRINLNAQDSLSTAKELANYVQSQNFDLILTGKESLDYNGGAVPGMLAQLLDFNFVNACVGLELNNSEAMVVREIDGGKETLKLNLPCVIAGQKGLVEESEVIIPNMRGIMSARTKPLQVIEPSSVVAQVNAVQFESVPSRASVKLVSSDNLDELIRLLNEEAKVI